MIGIAGFLAIAAAPVVGAPPKEFSFKPPLAVMPRIIAGGIEESDYPRIARRNDLTGETRASMTISPKGRVTRCSIVRTSGHAVLDERVCEIALTRMRLSPAIGTDGKRVEAEVVLPVKWILEEAPKPTK